MSVALDLTRQPFDRVVLTDAGGARTLAPEEFLSLPVSTRIRCVLERTVTFYLGDDVVDAHAALEALRRQRAVS